MNKLKTLKSLGFQIPWKLMSIGLYGLCEIPALLTRDELLDYLDSLLEHMDEQTDNIVSLICESDNYMKFDKLLKKFAENDESDVEIQKRKWRVYLLKTLLDHISQDSLQGLLELMEFWMSMGNPKDSPHMFPEGDSAAVQRYFTESTYHFLVHRNRDWLNKEISEIIALEHH